MTNERFHFFTTGPGDTFRDGGTLVDVERPWAMRDKVQHLVGGLLLARLTMLWLTLMAVPLGARILTTLKVVLLAALLNEAIEVFRMYRWWHRTSLFRMSGWEWHWDRWQWTHPAGTDATLTMALPASPPEWADSVSWKDIVATLIGGIIGL